MKHPVVAQNLKSAFLLTGLVALFLLLYPAVILAQAQAQQRDLQGGWLAINNHEDQHVRKDWWQSLSAQQVSAYIQAGADLNAKDSRGWTPLHSAARYSGQPAVLAALLETGALVNVKDSAGDTPLHWAAAENPNVKVLVLLLQAGADVNASDRFGWIPLHNAAAENSNPEIIRALLEAGSKRNLRAYFVLFSPGFLLKHNPNMSDRDKDRARAMLIGEFR